MDTIRALRYLNFFGIAQQIQADAEFVRIDDLHCLWTDVIYPIRVSHDGGVSWNSTGIYNRNTTGSYGGTDTCSKVFMFLSSTSDGRGVIYRSTDYGVTWGGDTIGVLGGMEFYGRRVWRRLCKHRLEWC